MKKLQLLCLLILASCASKKEGASSNYHNIVLESVCPTDGTCDIKILVNQSLNIKTDPLKNIFYDLKKDTTRNVIIFKYDRNIPKDVQDGSYREEIVLEIDNKTNEILNEKSLFGKFCYCKGQTGYYKIKEEISLKSLKDKKVYNLNFSIKIVPQIINNLKFSIN